MFNIEAKPTFTATVKVVAPDGTESDFKASFVALDIPTYTKFDMANPEGVQQFLNTALVGVDDIVGADGNAIADTPGLRLTLASLPWVRGPLVRTYLEAVNNAARGN